MGRKTDFIYNVISISSVCVYVCMILHSNCRHSPDSSVKISVVADRGNGMQTTKPYMLANNLIESDIFTTSSNPILPHY